MSDPTTFHWTYEDYVRLTVEGESFEFIDGKQFVNPHPTVWHQIVSQNLASLLRLHVRGQELGVLLHPPVDVVFADDTVLQPDLAVLLDEHRDRIREAGIFGAPDFVIEILLPSTASRDRHDKLEVYARYGVREYWLVDPERQRIEIFVARVRPPREEGRARLGRGAARSRCSAEAFRAAADRRASDLAQKTDGDALVLFHRGTHSNSGVSGYNVVSRSHMRMSNPSTFHWTYEDYIRLTDGEEYFEFIDGERFVNPRRPLASEGQREAFHSCVARYVEHQSSVRCSILRTS